MNIKIDTMEKGDFFLKETIETLTKTKASYEFDAKIIHKINRGY